MSAKPRPPITRSVKTPEALTALRRCLSSWPDYVQRRGESYYREGRVQRVWSSADHYVEARVRGGEVYTATLFFTRGVWSSRCSCPVGTDCKHSYAAGRAWIEHVASGQPDGADPLAAESAAVRTVSPVTREDRLQVAAGEFRNHWAPVLMSKLGRGLTAAETHQLENLGALFVEYTQANGAVYPGALLRHGFDYTPPPGTPPYAPAFAGQWDDATAPRDAWQLWQYIAADYERHGRPIPEVFQPMTPSADTLRQLVAERERRHELSAWHHALAAAEAPADGVPRAGVPAEVAGLRVRIRPEGSVFVEAQETAGEVWKLASSRVLARLRTSRPADFEHLSPPEVALAMVLAAEARDETGEVLRNPLAPRMVANLLRTRLALGAVVGPDGRPFTIEPEPLRLDAVPDAARPDELRLELRTPEGQAAAEARLLSLSPQPIYVFDHRLWHGPPPLPEKPLPLAALDDARLMSRLRRIGLRLPARLERNLRRVALRPRLRCWLVAAPGDDETMVFHAELLAQAPDVPCEQRWSRTGWEWTANGAPPPRRPDDPRLELDYSLAQPITAQLSLFQLEWQTWNDSWTRPVTRSFPDEFVQWRAGLPAELPIDASPGLASLLGPPLQAHVGIKVQPVAGAGRDWFDVDVTLRAADTTLTPEELALLFRARGKWVRLPRRGWQRLEWDETQEANRAAAATLDRLGIQVGESMLEGRAATHRVHTLQLAGAADLLERRDAAMAAALRQRAEALRAVPPAPLPAGLQATLRPYQTDGFRFLAQLSALGLGGVLADDMGLGKTVQTLAWLLHLSATTGAPERDARGGFRALVVCPKSVVHGWLAETSRFAPGLNAVAFEPRHRNARDPGGPSLLVVANYAQLRLHAEWFRQRSWHAVVLDEGQFIKNPGSQVAAAARSLTAPHRIVLTGTPIENRLTDLWSLFAFAQPGLLGTQSMFQRQYSQPDASALGRLHRRIQHFLLRRTKAQAAAELPPKTEDDVFIELEGAQRRLYDAELKRARAQLLGVQTKEALAAIRFNVLSSLLRLRQICCHPGLVDPAHRDLPSAKLDALLEQLEELRDEGNQVLVFSQFTEMLEIIRQRLLAAGIGHLMLTGQTSNRAELIEAFQRDPSHTVFLLSLKAAGFGLNLTAASYVILYDPWWNPAAESQAIDRTHRIGQTQPVVAYRLLARHTVEEKIRAMQRDKANLAAAVIHEQPVAEVLDLESLRAILA